MASIFLRLQWQEATLARW